MRYIAIYSLDMFPDEDRTINKECSTMGECINFLKEKENGSISFYHPQYYDKNTKKYYCAAWWSNDFGKEIV
jgi:hypothetical protein